MTKRRMLLLGIVLLAALLCGTFFRSDLVGWWRGEAKYKGRYTNSWRAELGRLKLQFGPSSLGHPGRLWLCKTRSWEDWLGEWCPSKLRTNWTVGHPLLEHDPEAIPVLIELLHGPERDVRFIAIEGLESFGPAAADAVPSLLELLQDEDWVLRYLAWQALRAIRPSAVGDIVPDEGSESPSMP